MSVSDVHISRKERSLHTLAAVAGLTTVEPQRRGDIHSERLDSGIGDVHGVENKAGVEGAILDARGGELRLSNAMVHAEHVEKDQISNISVGDVVRAELDSGFVRIANFEGSNIDLWMNCLATS